MLLLLTLLLAQAAPATKAPPDVSVDAAAPTRDPIALHEPDLAAPDHAPGEVKTNDAVARSESDAVDESDHDPVSLEHDPGAGLEHDPGAGPERDPSEPEEHEDDEPRSLDTSLESAAGRMGERHVELVARARSGEVTLVVGAETLASDRAPERRAVILGFELARGDLSWEGELRTAPQAAGLARLVARLGMHGDFAGLSLLGRDETLHGTRLRAAGLALDLDRPLDSGWRLALSASAWATDLSAPPQVGGGRRSRDPWSAFGAATLDWAQRWELSLSAKHTLGPLSIAASLGVAQPAQDGAYAARASLGLETQLGPARLALSVALAHLWPADLWLADAMLGISWHVGDD